MYIVKNTGTFPVMIRDLNLHIAGGKIVDLDELFKADTVRKSVDLKRLIKQEKIKEINKETQAPKPTPVFQKPSSRPQEPQVESKILVDLQKGLLEIKDMLRSGVLSQSAEEKQNYDEETLKRIADLQVKNLSDNTENVKKNFEQIGQSTKATENIDQLLGVLDSLDEKGD